jgi:Monooxygenase af470-like
MPERPKRETVDLSQYPDLVVVYLGMRVNTLTGIRTVLGFNGRISDAVAAKPAGLLLHEAMMYSLRHVGMRQYWRDFDSLEAWTRSEPHKMWWRDFLQDSKGTGFWHETYLRRGGMEAVYIDMPARSGFARFAPVKAARGSMFSARTRARAAGQTLGRPAIGEDELYAGPSEPVTGV